MIDWLSFRAHCVQSRPLHGGHVASITLDHDTGEERLDWLSPKRVPVRGSHDCTIQVRSCPRQPLDFIEISGNPAKYFQGHNVFGSDDLVGLSAAMYRSIVARLGLTPTDADLHSVEAGGSTLTRVDVTYSYELGSLPRVQSAIRSLELSAHLRHRGRGTLTKEGTLYFGKNSRRSSLKMYAKGQELQAHPLPVALRAGPLLEHAAGLLRVEAVFRSMWMQDRNMGAAGCWSGDTPAEQHRDMIGGLSIADAFMLDPDTITSLPPRLQAAYQLWKDGHDLRAMFPRKTFYRYRSQLSAHGIDIAVKQHRTESNVVPLPVILHAYPAQIPVWAVGTPLYFEPRQRLA